MAYFHDIQYITRLSQRLRNFKQRKDVFNFSCPLCGDSKKNSKKARGYIFRSQKSDKFFFKCYNCNESTTFSNFLKTIDVELYNEYSSLGSFLFANNDPPSEVVIFEKPKMAIDKSLFTKDKFKSFFTKIEDLPENHFARDYLANRKIPAEIIETEFFYTDDFRQSIINLFTQLDIPKDSYLSLRQNDSRIVIPFVNQEKKVIGFQGRTLDPNNKLRYITVKLDQDSPKIYGLDRLDLSKEKIYVLEGPIDSMFVPNSVAVMDANLCKVEKFLPSDISPEKVVLVFDNEPRSKPIVDSMETAIKKGFSVVILPERENCKDINDLVKKENLSTTEVVQLLDNNTYKNNTTARRFITQLEFNKWKKVS